MGDYTILDRWTCTDEHGWHELTVVHRTGPGPWVDAYDMVYYCRPTAGGPYWGHSTHKRINVGLDRARELAAETLARMPIAWVHDGDDAHHPIGGQ